MRPRELPPDKSAASAALHSSPRHLDPPPVCEAGQAQADGGAVQVLQVSKRERASLLKVAIPSKLHTDASAANSCGDGMGSRWAEGWGGSVTEGWGVGVTASPRATCAHSPLPATPMATNSAHVFLSSISLGGEKVMVEAKPRDSVQVKWMFPAGVANVKPPLTSTPSLMPVTPTPSLLPKGLGGRVMMAMSPLEQDRSYRHLITDAPAVPPNSADRMLLRSDSVVLTIEGFMGSLGIGRSATSLGITSNLTAKSKGPGKTGGAGGDRRRPASSKHSASVSDYAHERHIMGYLLTSRGSRRTAAGGSAPLSCPQRPRLSPKRSKGRSVRISLLLLFSRAKMSDHTPALATQRNSGQ